MGNPENTGQASAPGDEPPAAGAGEAGQEDTKYQGDREGPPDQGVPDDTEGAQEDTKYQG